MVPVPRRSPIASVDEEMQRLIAINPFQQDRQAAATTA